MGMYTEIVIKADVFPSISEKVKNILEYMFNRPDIVEPPTDLPDHPFFQTDRWFMIGSCNSFYHIPWTDSKYAHDSLFSRSDIKNYGGEIELFWDWIRPYLNHLPEQCIGYQWYEEYDKPKLIYMGEEDHDVTRDSYASQGS